LIRDPAALRPLLLSLHGRGLVFVDGALQSQRPAIRIADEIGGARLWADLQIDEEPTAAAIEARLQRLESLAREQGIAVALAQPYPITIKRLSDWWPTLERRNLVLVPASAAAGVQVLR
jgi:hypothetical protein